MSDLDQFRYYFDAFEAFSSSGAAAAPVGPFPAARTILLASGGLVALGKLITRSVSLFSSVLPTSMSSLVPSQSVPAKAENEIGSDV